MNFTTIIVFILITITSNAQVFTRTWETRFDAPKSPSSIYCEMGTVDMAGNLITAGTRDTGSQSMVFLHKVDENGNVLMDVKHFIPDRYYPQVKSVCTDINENIYVAGTYSTDYVYDLFIDKYSPSGQFIWQYRKSNISEYEVRATSDSLGQIYYFSCGNGTSTFGKLDSLGNNIWNFQNNSDELPAFKVISNTQFIYATTDWSGTVQLCDSAGSQTGQYSIYYFLDGVCAIDDSSNAIIYFNDGVNPDSNYILMLDKNLNVVWQKHFPENPSEPIIACKDGRIYIAPEYLDDRLYCYDYSGNQIWNKIIVGDRYQYIHPGNFGKVFITCDVGNSSLITEIDSSGNTIHTRTTQWRNIPMVINKNLIQYQWKAGNFYDSLLIYESFDSTFSDSSFALKNYYQYKADYSRDLLKFSNGDLLLVGVTNDSLQYSGRSILQRYDSQGNLIWSVLADGPFISKYFTDNSDNIYQLHQLEMGSNRKSAVLTKRNSSGQLAWSHSFADSVYNKHNTPLDVESDSIGNVYYCGSTHILGSASNAFVIKTDSLGNRIWMKTYPSANGYSIFASGLEWRYNRLQLLLYERANSPSDIIICELDTAGNIINQFNSPSPVKNNEVKLLIASNGDFITYGTMDLSPGRTWYVSRYDSSGNFIGDWTGSILLGIDAGPSAAVTDYQGNLLLTGRTENQYHTLKLDRNCNVVWEDTVSSNSLGQDIAVDSMFVYATGQTFGSSSAGFYTIYDSVGAIIQREWFQQTDSFISTYYRIETDFNCFYVTDNYSIDSCSADLRVYKYANLNVGLNELKKDEMRLYPNPFSKYFNLVGDYNKIELLNTTGKIVYSQSLLSSHHVIPEVPNGLYLCRLWKDNEYYNFKVVKID